jgi:small subunit ribosomal protein S20
MPQHKSAAKRMRQNERRRLRNRLQRGRVRTMMRKLRDTSDKSEALVLLNETKALLDRLAGKGVMHKNMAANYKSELEKGVNALA